MLRYEIPGTVPTNLLPGSGQREYGQNYVAIKGEKPTHHRHAVRAAREAGLTVKKTGPGDHVVSLVA